MIYNPLKKTASDELPYVWDWSEWLRPSYDLALANDVLSTAAVTATPSGLTLSAAAVIGDTVRVVIAAGVDGAVYKLECTVVTAAGLIATAERTLRIASDAR